MSEVLASRTKLQNFGLIGAFLALIIICLFPTPDTLSTGGHRMIGVLAFAIIIWMTTAVSYPVSAMMLMGLVALLLGFSPDVAHPDHMIGTTNALKMIISGYASPAMMLVAAAMFISIAMRSTGLDKRIAVAVLSCVGTKVNQIYFGVLATGLILVFFVPSATARMACLAPIILGIVDSLGIPRKSKLTALLLIGAVQVDVFWNCLIQTAAAQNLIALGFWQDMFGQTVSWSEWFIIAAPFAFIMAIIYFFLSKMLIKPEFKELAGGKEAIKKMKDELGAITKNEIKLLIISIALIFLWATSGKLHHIDITTVTIVAIAIMFLPGINILNWKDAQAKISWGTIVLFGAGIGLGTVLLKTKAAAWLANIFIQAFSLETATPLVLLAIMSVFLIVLHLGFSSAAALVSSMLPIVISILVAHGGDLDPMKMSLLIAFPMNFGFILPVNSPQGMVMYGTDTFEVKEYMKLGIPIAVISVVMLLVMGTTYWHWLGIM